ncbi:hypothetical protein OG760_29550 [Streptomyces sp. NBC_00963]|uniref:hypothetical protein n=1 Tax=unclassified Streptomyces TaxID=2593676 RepID=UPI002253B3F9|nr:hypothetical protein [Streptomyces sp. NBC_01306]MCX4722966.1 hypothetical protein [Streptomyces sp. NBC_01306]WSX45505.1 hypothetical protein OG760_29550 [Streptomyces sp. NBC_00963]
MLNVEQSKSTGELPFGLRYAVDPRPGTEACIDWSVIGYDPCRQIATVTEDGVTMPLITSDSATAVHSTSKSTSTAWSDETGTQTDSDSESDWS